MPIEVLMPALSPTMTEGNLAKWHKRVGDAVKAGDVLAEIETDKATMEVEAVDEGNLGEIVVPEGAQGVKVNTVIARILGEGEDKAALKSAPSPVSAPAPQAAPAQQAAPAPQSSAPPKPAAVPGPRTPTPTPTTTPNDAHRAFASPLARRIAAQANLNLSGITGSGPHGRIVKADVEAALKRGAPPLGAPAGAPSPVIQTEAAYTTIPHTVMRRTIAKRLAQVQQTVPVFYVAMACEIDALLAARADIAAQSGVKISVNDFIIKAAALALKKVPQVNASWSDEAMLRWNSVDVSVAVALEDGIITPIIRNADRKGLAQISAEMKDLGVRARKGELKLDEFQGGGFTISNLGMYGVKDFTAIINPPQSCILAVASGEPTAVVKNGAVAVATVMSCTLSCDHRVVDGAIAAEFMTAFKKFVESPVTMLL